jgi:hypothetical protein
VATLPAKFVEDDGVVLGYAMTTHKAEGLTVGASWTRPDGSTHHGTVLVDPTGADAPGLYVALSRHKGEVRLFAGLAQLEDPQTSYERGPAKTVQVRTQRGMEALDKMMRATESNADDRPVLDEQGLAPAPRPDRGAREEPEQVLDRVYGRLGLVRPAAGEGPVRPAGTVGATWARILRRLERSTTAVVDFDVDAEATTGAAPGEEAGLVVDPGAYRRAQERVRGVDRPRGARRGPSL